MITKKEIIEVIHKKLTDINDLLVMNKLDGVIKYADEDLYTIIQDIDNEISEEYEEM